MYIVKQENPLLNTTYNIVHHLLILGHYIGQLGDQSQTTYHDGRGKAIEDSVQKQAI